MKRNLGIYFIAGLVTLNVLLWIFFGPTTGQSKNFPQQELAETLSSSAMILWANGIFLSNKPRFLEPYFGGLDRMYVIHKNINILALLLIVVHLIIVPTTDKGGPGRMDRLGDLPGHFDPGAADGFAARPAAE